MASSANTIPALGMSQQGQGDISTLGSVFFVGMPIVIEDLNSFRWFGTTRLPLSGPGKSARIEINSAMRSLANPSTITKMDRKNGFSISLIQLCCYAI